MIVVLEKHSPLKVPFVFTSRRCVLWGGKCIYAEENKCSEHFPVFTVEPVELNDSSIRAGDIRQQSSDGAPYRHAPSVSPQWK